MLNNGHAWLGEIEQGAASDGENCAVGRAAILLAAETVGRNMRPGEQV